MSSKFIAFQPKGYANRASRRALLRSIQAPLHSEPVEDYHKRVESAAKVLRSPKARPYVHPHYDCTGRFPRAGKTEPGALRST